MTQTPSVWDASFRFDMKDYTAPSVAESNNSVIKSCLGLKKKDAEK